MSTPSPRQSLSPSWARRSFRASISAATSPLALLPECAREARNCSLSPAYPQAPQPTKDLISMK
jgi:hypothetical protein